MAHSCIVLLSGGLDSLLALRLMTIQGIEATALHGVNCFHGVGSIEEKKQRLASAAHRLGAKDIVFPDMTQRVIEVTKNPQHGFGRHLNACIDCRLQTIRAGFDLMQKRGAEFVVTGEVTGQRPMSQRRDAMKLSSQMAEQWGFGGLLVRPLCARLLPPTLPQINGWLSDEYLFDIQGRSRDRQMELAARLNLGEYPTPAGGCLLTVPEFGHRMADMVRYNPNWDANDAELLKVGRHFQTSACTHIVASRREEENYRLTDLARPNDTLYINTERNGAIILLRGANTPESEADAAGLAVWFSKMRETPQAQVRAWRMEQGERVDAKDFPAAPVCPDALRAKEMELTGGQSLKLMRAGTRNTA